MKVGDKIKALRKERRLTQAQLADKLNVAPTAVSAWERNANRPLMDKLTGIADLFEVPLTHFFDNDEIENLQPAGPQTVRIPVLGQIACGDPISADENFSGYRYKSPDNLPNGTLYILEARGASMEPTIPDGSEVLIREQSEVSNGEIAAVLVNGDEEATLKRIRYQGNTMMLMPDNSSYSPIVVSEDYPVKIIGKAIQITRNL